VTLADNAAAETIDAVGLEILRSRLQAVAEEGAIAIERTAISTVITECRDYSCTLLDATGALMVAGGAVTHHFGVCRYAVQVTLETHGESIADGDVFFANDPYNGGGLHSQDVLVQMPVFADGRLIAWVVNSGHVMDMGGMVFGSWTPEATDCFQESLRLPPVRLFQAGVEQRDMWQVLRTNVRSSSTSPMAPGYRASSTGSTSSGGWPTGRCAAGSPSSSTACTAAPRGPSGARNSMRCPAS
jgi:N-methylhydantoinase B